MPFARMREGMISESASHTTTPGPMENDATKSEMTSMQANVEHVADSTLSIERRIQELNKAKDNLGSIVSDLSAVSQENAASTEETNASMEELNATFSLISESAGGLQRLAEEMAQTIGYFKSE